MRKRARKEQPIITAKIDSLSHEGRGICKIDGKTTFVRGALTEENVEFKLTRQKGSYNEGEVINVLSKSKQRVSSACTYSEICGGCSLHHLQHEAQIDLKQSTLADQLKHFANITPNQWLPAMVDRQLGYRQKARLGVRFVRKKGKVLVGFREKNGRYIADIDRCVVLDPRVGEKLHLIARLVETLSVKEQIAQIEVACTETEVALIIRHLADFTAEDLTQIITFAKQHTYQIYLHPNKPGTLHKLHPNDQQEVLHYQLPEQNLTLQFHPSDFTQVNAGINRQMVSQAVSLLQLQKTDQVLELFCGLGNFTFALAQKSQQVIAVEGCEKMVVRGNKNAALNQINNTEFHAADLTQDFTSKLTDTSTADSPTWTQQSYDKLLLDPPRSGAQEILSMLPKWNPQRIVYISCNPATLARDSKIIIDKGYELQQAGIMDMFPHTQHVESIAVFTKRTGNHGSTI